MAQRTFPTHHFPRYIVGRIGDFRQDHRILSSLPVSLIVCTCASLSHHLILIPFVHLSPSLPLIPCRFLLLCVMPVWSPVSSSFLA